MDFVRSQQSEFHGVRVELSDRELVASIQSLRHTTRGLDVRLIVLLAEIEERRLHLRLACPSIFDFCRRKLHMSEGESSRRMVASRLVRKLPGLIPYIEAARIHLTTLTMLRDFLTESNIAELVTATEGKTKEKVKELLASLARRPDVLARIRKLPDRAVPSASLFTSTAPQPNAASQTVPAAAASLAVAPTTCSPSRSEAPSPTPARAAAHSSKPGRIEPLAPARYKLEMTIGVDEREKLERVQALMRHRLRSGDLAAIFGEALDLLVAKLEKERLGVTTKPRRARATSSRTRHIPRAVRRAVFERDGEQCTFRDTEGQRCSARALLELDHVRAFGQGGEATVENLRVRCRAHNHLHAEDTFGATYVAKRIKTRQRKSDETRRASIGRAPTASHKRMSETECRDKDHAP